MEGRSDGPVVIIRVAAGIGACVFCVLIGWMIYRGSLHPAGPQPDAVAVSPADSPLSPVQQGSVANADHPIFLTIPSATTTVSVPCASFGGFSYAKDAANMQAAIGEARSYLQGTDVMPFQLEYRCDTKQGPALVTTYTFYSVWGHSSYNLIQFGMPGIPDDFNIYPVSYPGDGCAKPLQWNVSSAAVLTQFLSASGSAVFADGIFAQGSGSLDMKLTCMPPGKMEWIITANSGTTGKTAYDEYPALTR